jgi:hypothetical protein
MVLFRALFPIENNDNIPNPDGSVKAMDDGLRPGILFVKIRGFGDSE